MSIVRSTGLGWRGDVRVMLKLRVRRAIAGARIVAPRVDLVGADGRVQRVLDPGLRLSHDSAFRIVDDGALRCIAPGDATLTLIKGRRTTTLVARCRATGLLGGTSLTNVDLTLGGSPQAIEIVAIDSSGRREPIRRFVASIRDSGIVEERDGFLHAIGVGSTMITFDVGGARFPSRVAVRQVIAHDTLRLSPGEFRSWSLQKGRYEITMQRAGGPPDFNAIEMSTEGAKCVRDTQTDERIHCLVRERGGLAVRNLASAASGREQRAVLWVVKVP